MKCNILLTANRLNHDYDRLNGNCGGLNRNSNELNEHNVSVLSENCYKDQQLFLSLLEAGPRII